MISLCETAQGPLRHLFPNKSAVEHKPVFDAIEGMLGEQAGLLPLHRPPHSASTAILLATAFHAVTNRLSRVAVIVTNRWAEAHWRREVLKTTLAIEHIASKRLKSGIIDLGYAVLDSRPLHAMRGCTYQLDGSSERFRPDLVLIDRVIDHRGREADRLNREQDVNRLIHGRTAHRVVCLETV